MKDTRAIHSHKPRSSDTEPVSPSNPITISTPLVAAAVGIIAGFASSLVKDGVPGSFQIGVGLLLFLIVEIGRFSCVSVPIPLIAAFMCNLQLLVAPWISHWFPTDLIYEYTILDMEGYIDYALPVVFAFTAACYLPLLLFTSFREPPGHKPFGEIPPESADLLALMFWGGVFLSLAPLPLPGELRFIALLAGNLKFVSAYTGYLADTPTGRRNMWIVHLVLLIESVISGFFHDLLLWGAASITIVGLKTQRARGPIAALAGGVFAIMLLQHIKTEYRAKMTEQHDRGMTHRVAVFSEVAMNVANDPGLIFEPATLGRIALRFNQGWIVAKVLQHVPRNEPHCGSEILQRHLTSLIPRFLAPDKYIVGGREHFERFTGHKLWGASMGLGYAGEMYAAFGREGGIAGVAVYGLGITALFLWFSRFAVRNILFWSWLPYLMLISIKAEDSGGHVLNWIFKSSLIMAGLFLALPEVRRLFLSQTPDERAQG